MLSDYAKRYGEVVMARELPSRYTRVHFWFDLGYEEGEYRYLSLYRPLWVSAGDLEVELVRLALFDDECRSALFTRQPIPAERVASYQLTPVGKSMGQFIADYAEVNGQTVELAREVSGGLEVAVIHPSAKFPEKLQLSWFDGRGPMGDETGTDAGELAAHAYTLGFRRWMPGLLQELSRTFDPALLNAMTKAS